eukprot:10541811-Alexandrium_andersonii.AAC.1
MLERVEEEYRRGCHLKSQALAFLKRVEQTLAARKGISLLSSRVCRFTLGQASINPGQPPCAAWELTESILDPAWARPA